MDRSFLRSGVGRAIWLALVIAVWPGSHVRAAEDAEAKKLVPIDVKLVDGDGKPIEGAEVGTNADVNPGPRFRALAAEQGTEWHYLNHARSGADGVAHLSAEPKYFGDWSSLIARHEGRKISGVVGIDLKKLDEPIRITLLPEREIVAEVVCPELSPEVLAGVDVWFLQVDTAKGLIKWRFREPRFRISVPPGACMIAVESNSTHWTKRDLVIAPGPGEQRIEPIELKLTELARLIGKPAPEIPGVVAWKNSDSIRLADLRGKVVLLDFCGYWCPGCLKNMPKIFDLYDKYHDQGLEVIGIHVDVGNDGEEAVDTVAKLDARLAATRQQRWNGRDFPFPVALVVGKRQGIAFGESIVDRANSAASALFGAGPVPAYILIDRRGNVVGKFSLSPRGGGIALLEKTLAEK